MTQIVQANYDTLQTVAGKFGQQSQAVGQMLQAVLRSYGALHSGGWVGHGAEAFFSEMQGEVSPAVKRLAEALAEANRVTGQICKTLNATDQEASSPFKQDPDRLGRIATVRQWVGGQRRRRQWWRGRLRGGRRRHGRWRRRCGWPGLWWWG